jgi:hypothetical protein
MDGCYTETDRGDDDSSVDSNQVVDWILKLNTMGHKGPSAMPIYLGARIARSEQVERLSVCSPGS